MRPRAVNVLIVDDSALVRTMLTQVLSGAADITVVGGAKDPYEARELIIKHRPDVIILDIEMPRMNGLVFLRKLMEHYPVPVIMCSGIAPANSQKALEALEIGAVDVVSKPTSGGSAALHHLGEELADKIRAAAIAMQPPPPIPESVRAEPLTFQSAGLNPNHYFVAIGASTGGTEAINTLLTRVPADFPPVAMVQHMPEGFTRSFAERLNQNSRMNVSEAVDGDILIPGKAVLARGGIQMRIANTGGKWKVIYGETELTNRHCPSVDVLFDSVVECAGRQLIGILLTGMGNDGAKGLLKMSQNGAITVTQDQRSCVVYGMPKVAVEIGASQYSASPAEIPSLVTRLLQHHPPRRFNQTGGEM